MSIELTAFKRLRDSRYGVRMLVTYKARRHPVRTILRAPRGPVGRSLKVRQVIGAGERQLLTKRLNRLPVPIGDLGEREHIASNLTLLALEQAARLRAVEQPPPSVNGDPVRPFQGAVARERHMAVPRLHHPVIVDPIGIP